MNSVYILMEHKADGNFSVIEVHEDHDYAVYSAVRMREQDDRYYRVIEHKVIMTPTRI